MPHFYKRLAAMVLMCAVSLCAVRGLPMIFPASTIGVLHYTPVASSDKGTVMTIDGNPITAEEYAFYFIDYANAWNNMLASLGMNWASVWSEEEFLEQVRGSVDEELTSRQAALGLIDQHNIHLTRAQIDEVLSMKQEAIDSLGGEEGFQEQLNNIGMSETMFDNRLYCSYIYGRLNEVLFGDGGQYQTPLDQISTYMQENYLRAKHVLISDETENAEAIAQEVAQRAQAGESFDGLIMEYGEDPGMISQPEGYAFKEGDMVDEFYQGTAALAEGGISDPIRSDFGWHIIQRLPFDEAYVKQNRASFAGYMEAYSLDDLLSDRAAAMEVVRNDELYQAIDLNTVQDYLPSTAADDSADAATDEAETPETDETEPAA